MCNNFYDVLIESNEKEVVLSGKFNMDENSTNFIDEVAFDNVDINSNVEIECKFDMDKLQFVLMLTLIDENHKVLDSKEFMTDAIVTDTGKLDAYVELGATNSFYLSDYKNDGLDECAWWIINKIKTIAPIYIAVAETAEQIKAKSNYNYNKKLENEFNGQKGVKYGYYITNQSQTNYSSYPGYCAGNYKFGFTNFKNVGCEVAATYNLMISLNRTEMLSETIYKFEKWGIEISSGWGNLESDPNKISKYLDKSNISYSKIKSYAEFSKAVECKSDCKIIMSNWNNGGMLKSVFGGDGLHTYFINKKQGTYNTYNFIPSTQLKTYNFISQIKSSTGDFIVGYIIN